MDDGDLSVDDVERHVEEVRRELRRRFPDHPVGEVVGEDLVLDAEARVNELDVAVLCGGLVEAKRGTAEAAPARRALDDLHRDHEALELGLLVEGCYNGLSVNRAAFHLQFDP